MQRALRFDSELWFPVRDGDMRLRDFYNRHYTTRGSDSPFIVGPGGKLVLLSHAVDALFAWRKFDDDCQLAPVGGINCAVFRREAGAARASDLIRAAEPFAIARWFVGAPLRLYTYVNPKRVRSSNPGCCFKLAGYRRIGRTAGGHGRDPLDVLEKVVCPT